MYNKDISICKKVILDLISELKQREKNVEFETESWEYMMNRLALMKALDIIKKEKPNK